MIKAIFFDLDGIIITGNKKLFSQRLSEENNIPLEKVSEFFLNDFRECSFGRADLKEKIAPYLIEWGYKGTVDDLLKYWFENENTFDPKILDLLKDLKGRGIKCYITTRQEKYRKEYMFNKLGLKNYFDDIFCTCDIGYDKSEKAYWDYVFNKVNSEPDECMYFDDKHENLDIAQSLGIKSYLFINKEELEKVIKENLAK
jgi:putative hydrolase of the HAD superfamily